MNDDGAMLIAVMIGIDKMIIQTEIPSSTFFKHPVMTIAAEEHLALKQINKFLRDIGEPLLDKLSSTKECNDKYVLDHFNKTRASYTNKHGELIPIESSACFQINDEAWGMLRDLSWEISFDRFYIKHLGSLYTR